MTNCFHVRVSGAVAFMSSVLATSGAVPVVAQDREILPARDRLVEGWLIAGSSEDESRRKVSTHQLGSGGWPQFVNEKARPVYDWGLRRFWLHNPFGTLSDEVMQFDQYLDAQDAGIDVLTENFSEAWAPVVQGAFGQPIELIAYLGTADSADDRLKAAFDAGNPASILGTMLACVKPVLLAGGSIGADAAVKLSDDGPAFHFYKYLESIGIPVYVESRPKIANPKWAEFPVFAVDGWWKRSDPANHADCVPWALPNEAMQRGVVRWIRNYNGRSTDPAVIEDLVRRIREALLEGHTVIFRSDGLRAAGVSFEQLIEGIDEQLGVESDSNGGSSQQSNAASGDAAPEDGMDGIEAKAEEIPPSPVGAAVVTPTGGSTSSGGASPRGGSAGGSGSGSSPGSSGSIEIKPRGNSSGVRVKPGMRGSIQRMGDGVSRNGASSTPRSLHSRVIRRLDAPGRSRVIRTSTGRPADWIERARRSARRITIANGRD